MPESTREQKERTRMEREIRLLKTLAVTVCVFLACWIPFGVVVLFFSKTIAPEVKKVSFQRFN